jgi:hypothetical protein
MRFDQPDYSRPRAGSSLCTLSVWSDFVRHMSIIAKDRRCPQRGLRFTPHFLPRVQTGWF